MGHNRPIRACLLVAAAALAAPAGAPPVGAARAPVTRAAAEVRTTWTAELGVARPDGIAYDARRGELLVADERGGGTAAVRVGFDEAARGTLTLAGVADADSLAYDPAHDELVAPAGAAAVVASPAARGGLPPVTRRDLGAAAAAVPADADGATFDRASGTWWLLDADRRAVTRVDGGARGTGRAARVPLRGLDPGALAGLAHNPSDGLLYVANTDRSLLYGFDASGTLRKRYSYSSIAIGDLTAMTFAPSADRTDPDTTHDLYVADAGTPATSGGVTEISLAAEPVAALAVVNQTASLVNVIHTSQFTPGSPDPSGIAWLPGADRLLIVDSEVEEVTGAGYHGVNLWQLTRTGTVVDTGTLHPNVSREPTGASFDPATGTLFVSDDSKRGIHVIRPGADGRYGTPDDVLRFVNGLAFGSDDTEDPAFDPTTGHLYFSDAISAEIYEVDPVDGVFGDGNDVVTHFDVGVHGVRDGEGLAFDAVRNTLLVGDRSSRRIYEITKGNELLRVIDARVPGLTVLSGLEVAPAPGNPSRRDYWIVDRAVDNGPNPNENDGKIFQVSAPAGPVDAPPTVALTGPAEGATVSGAVVVQAAASDDVGVTQVQFSDGATAIGTDTNGADGWSVTWDTTGTADGAHTLRATATDTAGQTATTTRTVTVRNGTPGTPTVLEVRIAAGNDDVEERLSDGRIDRASTDLDLMLDNTVVQSAVGLRFLGLTIPRGAVVTSAWVQFRADESWSDPTTLRIDAVASDSAPAFGTARFSLSGSARTGASTDWVVPGWVERRQGPEQRTPDLAAVLQELVNRPGWQPGNAVALVVSGNGRRVAKAYEAGAASAALLHVEYTVTSP
ncbi:MAG: hypothetical protein KatS3mg009_2328 [Acidimicrobiia bacterium]|nr:MAG: hypothetical protein KatS3mg009_2328 [Acidimicrobiia bacterium]